MRDFKLTGCLGLAILVLALSLAGTACQPSMLGRGRQVCTIDTAGALELNAKISFGGLVIKPIRPSANNRERIEVKGPMGDIQIKNGIYEILAYDETAEVYVDPSRAITLTGNIGRDLRLTNHHGPVNISGNVDHIGILNQEGDLRLNQINGSVSITNLEGNLRLNRISGSVSITNHKGNLDAMIDGNLDLLNHETGDTSITADGNVHITNLTGNLQATALGDFKLLNQNGGDTTITAHGDASIQNFGYKLEKGVRFEILMKNRPEVERVLKEKGHSLQIQASGFGVIKLENIDAQRIEVRGRGLNILGVYALETTLRMADNCALQNIQSPLKMYRCSNSSLNGLEMDYSLENCSGMQVNPRNQLGPHGTLKQCRNIIFWDTPADRVSQIGCQDVIFARQTTPSAPGG